MEYSSGDRQDPWETPTAIFLEDEVLSCIFILKLRSLRKDCISFIRCFGVSVCVWSLYISPSFQTLSKAFSTSRNIATVCILLFIFFASSSVSLTSWVVAK